MDGLDISSQIKVKRCMFCKSKDEQIQHLKDMGQKLDDMVTVRNDAIERLIKEWHYKICPMIGAFDTECLVKCGSFDCHTKIFNKLLEWGKV